MKRYGNLSGNSGVSAYHLGRGWIQVRFKDDGIYKYTTKGIGREHLVAMKRLAEAGEGLSSYISTHPEVRNGHEPPTEE